MCFSEKCSRQVIQESTLYRRFISTIGMKSTINYNNPGGGRGVLPSKRLRRCPAGCGRISIHGQIDNNGAAFSLELLSWGRENYIFPKSD